MLHRKDQVNCAQLDLVLSCFRTRTREDNVTHTQIPHSRSDSCICKKIFLKRNLAHLRMAQCMNALADKVYTKTRSAVHTVICTP